MKLDDWQRQAAFEERLRIKRARKSQLAAKAEEARLREVKLRTSLEATNRPKPVSFEFASVVNVCSKMAEHLKPQLTYRGAEESDYAKAVAQLLKISPLRPLKEWKPQGKSASALFRSLGGHLIAKYPMPPFIWSGFFGEANRRVFPSMIEHLAGGGSLVEYIKTRNFPIKLTRKQCHEFMKSPADLPIVHALRRTQVLGTGGSARLLQALVATRLGTDILFCQDEEFVQSVIQWFANQPMLDPNQVGPLFDYVQYCRAQDLNYTLKGRTGLSLMRAMEAWHADTARNGMRNYKGAAIFKSSGFQGAEYDFSRRDSSGNDLVEIWRIKEILTAKDLAAEGKRQGHCVFSYNRRIETGVVSIWVLSKEDNKSRDEHGGVWHMLTLEVSNAQRLVVQARGRFNRPATAQEKGLIQRWLPLAAYT